MKLFSHLAICALAMFVFMPFSVADENAAPAKKGGKGQRASAGMMKKLESVELTAEQKEKIESLASTLDTAMAALREEGFTPELQKMKAEAMKKAREEGKKGKDLAADVIASLEATDEQKAALTKAGTAQAAFQKGLAETLTAEQIAKLPEDVQKSLTLAKRGKGKKPKKAAAE